MPPSVRELIRAFERAGFQGGKGSHRNFVHSSVPKPVVAAGTPGDDAERYEIWAADKAIREANRRDRAPVTPRSSSGPKRISASWAVRRACCMGVPRSGRSGGLRGTLPNRRGCHRALPSRGEASSTPYRRPWSRIHLAAHDLTTGRARPQCTVHGSRACPDHPVGRTGHANLRTSPSISRWRCRSSPHRGKAVPTSVSPAAVSDPELDGHYPEPVPRRTLKP